MASPRDLRRRIRSISSTSQITRAMQMVAASKMRKAQEATLTMRPFAQLLYRMQRRATTHARDFTHPLLAVREVRRRAVRPLRAHGEAAVALEEARVLAAAPHLAAREVAEGVRGARLLHREVVVRALEARGLGGVARGAGGAPDVARGHRRVPGARGGGRRRSGRRRRHTRRRTARARHRPLASALRRARGVASLPAREGGGEREGGAERPPHAPPRSRRGGPGARAPAGPS